MRKFACPCCGFLTLIDPSYWSFEVCPVCSWKQDPEQKDDPLYWGGANGIAQLEGVKNFGRCGASHPDEVLRVRAPHIDEIPVTAAGAPVLRTKAQLNSIARAILSDKIPALSGCRAIAALAGSRLLSSEPELYRLIWVFEAVAGEANHFRDEVALACKALQDYLGAEFAS